MPTLERNMASTVLRNAVHSTWLRILFALLVLIALLVLAAAFFPFDLLREPLNRYVSEHTGRHFEITRRLDVKLGRTTRILADGVVFANPAWARDAYLVRAQSAEIDVNLWPLLHRHVELPLVAFHQPELGLQMEPDGRKSWALGRDTSDPRNVPEIGSLVIDDGSLHFVATEYAIDVNAQFTTDPASSATLPLKFTAKGTWRKQPFEGGGRAGNVLQLAHKLEQPFPAELRATAGRTTLTAHGQVRSMATLDGASAQVELRGADLADLWHALGVVMPDTPPYTARFALTKEGPLWDARNIVAKLGNSDLAGNLKYDGSGAKGLLTGDVHSKTLDFNDLAPLVGLPPQPPSAAATHVAGSAPVAKAPQAKPARDPNRKVLPNAKLDVARLRAMNADVRYSAGTITHPRELPFESAKLRIDMKDGVLKLDPMDVGIAGGHVAGRLAIDARTDVAAVDTHLAVRDLQLNRMFPTLKTTHSSLGRFEGQVALRGRGNSVAQVLATSSGDVGVAMGQGQVSRLLLEAANLHVIDILRFLGKSDETVQLRCLGAGFDVRQGKGTARVLVLDTAESVIYGQGGFDFGNETIDLQFHPVAKDKTILSLRSPLHLTGTFSAPHAGVEMGAVAGKGLLALALTAINPVLGLASTIDVGPGKDANCGAVLREATGPDAMARVAATAALPASAASAATMGGPPHKGGALRRFFDRLGKGWGNPTGHPGAQYPLDPPPHR